MEKFKPATLTMLALSGATLCLALAAIPPITGIGFAEKAFAATPPQPPPSIPKPSKICFGAVPDKDLKCVEGWRGDGAKDGQRVEDPDKMKLLPSGAQAWLCPGNTSGDKVTNQAVLGTLETTEPQETLCPKPSAVHQLANFSGKPAYWVKIELDPKKHTCGTYPKYITPNPGTRCTYVNE